MKLKELIEKLQAVEKSHENVDVVGQWADVHGNGYSTTTAFVLDADFDDRGCMITLGPHERDIALYRRFIKEERRNA